MTNTTCSIEDCDASVIARGLCARHYGIQYRRGTLPSREVSPRHFLSSIDKDAATAVCQVCGPVSIRVRRDRKSHECGTLRAAGRSGQRLRVDNLRRNYGLSEGDYDAMAARQNGLCAICGTVPPRGLVVDHDHSTGAVRDLLCNLCNSALGFMKDDIGAARAAVEYLIRHSAA